MAVKTKHLKPILRDGQRENIFTNKVETEELSDITMGAIRLLMFKWRASNFEFDLKKRGEKMIQSLLNLITCHQNHRDK